MKLRSSLYSLLFASVAIAAPAVMYAQGIITGSLSGTVTDSSGAVIPNATVTALDTVKGTKFTTTSRPDGSFTFQGLPIDTYNVTISNSGFSSTQIKGVIIQSGNDSALGKQILPIASAGDSVTVEGESGNAELNTTQAQVSATFDSKQLESLPLGNGFDEVALLTPGVVQTHDLNFSNTNGVGFSSNGSRGRSNNFELDGQSNNDNSVAGPQIFFGNQDAIAEIQVIQSNFSAQYGRNTGAVVNYITKSGTNAIHGSGFELYEGSFLSSYPNQDKSSVFGYCAPGQDPSTGCAPVARLPRSVDNKYGATLGGPILKDKLFAFGSTYFEHTRNGASPFNSAPYVTPTPTGIAQLLEAFPNNPAVQILKNNGPYGVTDGNPQPFGTPTLETVTVGSKTVSVPVSPVNRLVASGNYTDQEDLGRIDYQFTPKDRLYVRYFYQKSLSSNDADGGAGGTFYDVPDTNHSVGADLTHTFSAAWLNQVRFAFQQSKLDFQAGSFPNCTTTSLTVCPGNVSFQGGDQGFGEATNLPQGRTVKVTQIQDNANFNKGRNTIVFGGEVDIQNSPNVFLPNYNGAGRFGNLNNFLNQSGTFTLGTGNPVEPFKENDFALYFQDDLKATKSLTVNLGLRWEFFGQAVNKLHDETVARESNPATALWDPTLPLSVRTTPNVKNAYKNFEPRIGFAFNPDFDKKLVIRGGYSIGFDPAFYNIFLNVATLAPVAVTGSINCGGTCLGNGNFTGAGLRTTNLGKLPLGGNPATADQEFFPLNFHNPYLQTYSLGVEHQVTNKLLLLVRYVGTHSTGQFQSLDGNPDLSAVQAAFPSYAPVTLCATPNAPGTETSILGAPTARPNCNLSNQTLVGNFAFSVYNSLQAEATMSNFHGFSGNINYTLSHSTDNSSEVYSSGAGGNTIANPQNPLDNDQGERGTSGFSLPNNVSVGMSYTVPRLNTSREWLTRAVNGFQVNSVYQWSSGQAYNPYQPILAEYGLTNSFCDNAFNADGNVGSGADSCRLVLANKSAPVQSISIVDSFTPAPGSTSGAALPQANYEQSSFVTYSLNNGLDAAGHQLPIPAILAPNATHWTIDNQNIAKILNNPYPGSGRNILRAQTYNNLDASLFKDSKINERITLELQLNAYNALNRQYRGTPLANAFNNAGFAGVQNPFLSNAYNGSSIGGGTGVGTRNVQLGAKVKF